MKNKLSFLLLCFSMHTAQAQILKVENGTVMKIIGNTPLYADGLVLNPTTDFILTNENLSRNTTLANPTCSQIERVYKFSSNTNPFYGNIKINYTDGSELNGISETDLKVNIYDGSDWEDYANAANSTSENYVKTIPLSGLTLNELTLNNISTTTWDGSSWNNGAPTELKRVVISGNYTATSDLDACSLKVKSNAMVTVNSGNDFNITDKVSVASGSSLTFNNNANLLQDFDVVNSGNITSKRATTMRRQDYTYWASPVAGQNLFNFSPLTLTNRFYTMNELTNSFESIDPGSNNMISPKGYMVRAPNNFTTTPSAFTGVFYGVPNNGASSIGITHSMYGYNLIGNPYPSPLDADLFLAANPGTLYFWTHTSQAAESGANYASYNTTGGTAAISGGETPNGTIQTGQGFILQTAAAGNAIFNNDMRVGNNSGQFYRTATIEKHRIWLNLGSPVSALNQILIGYVEGATMNEDISIDGKMIESGSSISSRIGDNNYVIQGRALPFNTNDVVPLSFYAASDGTYILSIDHIDGLFAGDQDIFIKDNLFGITHNIKQSPYSFNSVAGSFNARFELVYTSTVLSTENPVWNENSVVVFKKDGVLSIDSGNAIMQSVNVFDMRGRLLFKQSGINASSLRLEQFRAENQILLIQVISEDNRTVTKKVVY